MMNDAAADGEGARCLHCGFRIEPAGNGWRGADGFQTCTAAPGAMLHSPNLAARAAAPVEAGLAERVAEALALLPPCYVTRNTAMPCTDWIGAEFGNGIWLEAMCCLPCRVRALLRPAPAADGGAEK